MSDMIVNFIGKEYSIPKDVIAYIDLLDFADSIQKQLMADFISIIKGRIQNKEVGLIDDEDLRTQIEKQVGRFIAKLCDQGIFTRTVNDYLNGNKGYEYFSKVNKAALEKVKSFLMHRLDSLQEGYEDAVQRAESHVTGMGFSIWSSSFVNHAIYAAMEASTINKQEKEASAKYQKEVSELCSKLESEYDRATSQYINNEYIPNMEAALTVLAYELLDKYIADLIANGKFDKRTLDFVNISRSNDLLKNLELSQNTDVILHKAFEACPYNLQIYAKALNYGLMDYTTYQTAQQFRQDKNILFSLVSNLGEVEYPCKFRVNYNVADKMAEFTECDVISVLQAKTKDYVASVTKAYGDAVKMLDNRQQAIKIMGELSEAAILSGSSVSKGRASAYIGGIVSQNVWVELTEKCGYIDLFDKIRAQVPGAESAITKRDIDLLLEEKLYPMLEEARQIREKEIIKKREDEAKQKAAEAEKARLTAERNKIIKKICFVAAIVVVVIVIASAIITKVNNAKAYQDMAGEFCVYRVINDEGEERDEFNWWLSINEDGTVKMSSWSYAFDDTVVDSYSGKLKNKANFRNFEDFRIEDYCADASEYEKAEYCYEFHIADEWDEFDGYIVCWQYQNGKIVDVYCDDYRYTFVETDDNYGFNKWEKEIDSDGLSEKVKNILENIVNSQREEESAESNIEYDEYLTWYNIKFASSFLGKELNADGGLSMGPGDYEAMSNEMYLFDIPGRFSHGWSSADSDPVIIDILDWVTTKPVDDFDRILNPLVERYGDDYRVQHYNDASGDAYMWKNVEMYEYVICWQNTDGTVDIRWTYSVSTESQENTDSKDDTYNNPITEHTPGMFLDYQLGGSILPDHISKQIITINEVNGHLYYESTDNTTIDSLYWVSSNSNGNKQEIVDTAHERIISYFESRYGLGKEVNVPSGVFPHYWGFDDETVTQFITETGLAYLVSPDSEYNIYVVQIQEPYE